MDCKHENIIYESNIHICADCGECIRTMINFNISVSNTDDCNIHNVRQNYEKNIYKDISHMGFSQEIENYSNDIFLRITDEKTKKSKKRISIIFGCVYVALKTNGKINTFEKDSITVDQLLRIFNIPLKRAMKGVRIVLLKIPKDIGMTNNNYVPVNLIIEFMKKLNGTQVHIDELCLLYSKIYNRSSIINGSRPKSVIAGLIYYYINTKSNKIDLKRYRKIIGISELTIIKIYNEVERIINE
jgi:transcription initiation factor TFIIIB Brf1 subunit/transcription initiation factor TFIIB